MSAASDALEYVERLEQALEATTGRFTQAVATLTGLSLNSVLRSELLILDHTTGQAHVETSAPYASVGVYAYDSAVTVTSGPIAATAPTRGIGTLIVPSGRVIVWPLAGTEISLFGTIDARVLLTLWSAPQVPSVGGTATGVDGGGA